MNTPIKGAKIPYFKEIGKLPGGKYLQAGLDFFLGTDGGNITPLTVVFAVVSFIPGGALATRAGKGLLKLSPKLAKLIPKVSKLFKSLKNSKIVKAMTDAIDSIKKYKDAILDGFELIANPNKLFAVAGKYIFGKSGVIEKFKNLATVQRILKTPVGKFLVSAKKTLSNAYDKFLEMTTISSLNENYNNAKKNVVSLYNTGKKEIKKFIDNPLGYLKGAGKNTVNWIKNAIFKK
ncbi:MAG: hypothetical protein LBU40_06110 [Methanobrevibacter sp.]|jgi:hypothetical protein|nr:hypothetical protein [Methanobrevibacter sp.]